MTEKFVQLVPLKSNNLNEKPSKNYYEPMVKNTNLTLILNE